MYVAILSASFTSSAATAAFVLAMAGMMLPTTPLAFLSDTSSAMLNLAACALAVATIHSMCSGRSLSSFCVLYGDSLSHMCCAYATQCAALRGVFTMVHSWNTVCGGNSDSEHSKQLVMSGRITRQWPLKPSVPPSISGMMVSGSWMSPSSSTSTIDTSVELIQRRASIESRPAITMLNFMYHSSGWSWILPWCAVMLTSGTRRRMNAAATSAFDLPTSACRNRNCRFRFDTSMVSMSITSILRKPVSARFLSSSQPRPPAPITSTRQSSRRNLSTAGSSRAFASKPSDASADGRLR
mmetsp:Transcript_26733/g.64996  ORF Transcript_26733/g.64996 Transcript_26733/m.64996 type:complete len:297 (-) Transcript_26733:133-1023(-)